MYTQRHWLSTELCFFRNFLFLKNSFKLSFVHNKVGRVNNLYKLRFILTQFSIFVSN